VYCVPEQLLGEFQGLTVKWLQILDENGNVDAALEPALSSDRLKFAYKTMVRSRAWDEKAIILQRQGRLGTMAPAKGQEAAQVGSCMALDNDDWMFPSFREVAAYLTRGTPMKALFVYNMGSEWGNRAPEDRNDFTIAIPVASQIPHAVGVAMAAKIKGDHVVSLVYFGDGATSEGDFHEAMNFAGVFKAPVIFLNQNNQWAISVPREKQTASKTIAQKAIAYGFEGIQVDGNDLLAVYRATRYAVDKARQGNGPTLIEAVTYRMAQHTTADDPTKYRSPDEVKAWEAKDPIKRFRIYLERKGLWNQTAEEKFQEEVGQEIAQAIKEAELDPKIASPDPTEMFQFMFAEMPKRLQEQMASLKQELQRTQEPGGKP